MTTEMIDPPAKSPRVSPRSAPMSAAESGSRQTTPQTSERGADVKLDVGAASPAPRMRFEHLDGLRACCSLWVVLEHHASKLPDGDDFAGGHFAYFLSRGNAAVSYFVVLSGFVMSYAYGERSLDAAGRSSFFIKRFGRVGLTYYTALLLAWLTAPPLLPG